MYRLGLARDAFALAHDARVIGWIKENPAAKYSFRIGFPYRHLLDLFI
jgi:hypothetical protein